MERAQEALTETGRTGTNGADGENMDNKGRAWSLKLLKCDNIRGLPSSAWFLQFILAGNVNVVAPLLNLSACCSCFFCIFAMLSSALSTISALNLGDVLQVLVLRLPFRPLHLILLRLLILVPSFSSTTTYEEDGPILLPFSLLLSFSELLFRSTFVHFPCRRWG